MVDINLRLRAYRLPGSPGGELIMPGVETTSAALFPGLILVALGIAVAIAAGVYGRQAAARAAVEGTGEEVDEDL